MNPVRGPDQWGTPSLGSADAASVRRSQAPHSLQAANAYIQTLGVGEVPKLKEMSNHFTW